MNASFYKASSYSDQFMPERSGGFNVDVEGKGMVLQRIPESQAREVVSAIKAAKDNAEVAEILSKVRVGA